MAKPASKSDKDMGREVNNLGGYRPNTNRLKSSPVVTGRYVEILIISPGGAFGGPRLRHRSNGTSHQKQDIITFGKSAFDF